MVVSKGGLDYSASDTETVFVQDGVNVVSEAGAHLQFETGKA